MPAIQAPLPIFTAWLSPIVDAPSLRATRWNCSGVVPIAGVDMHVETAPDPGAASDRQVAAALRRRLDRPLVLVGMMGVGKTSLGRRLAALLGVAFVDADEEIATAAQMSIAEIFATYDEAYFRAGERRVIARLLDQAPQASAPPGQSSKVIATGGGAFCDADTRALILRRGIAVWLDAELDTLVERTGRKTNRPLLQNGNRREILARLQAERQCHYAQAPIHVKSGNASQLRATMQAARAILAGLDAMPDARP